MHVSSVCSGRSADAMDLYLQGLEIALNWFIDKGYHKTVAFVPHTYANPNPPASGPRANVADDRPRLRVSPRPVCGALCSGCEKSAVGHLDN